MKKGRLLYLVLIACLIFALVLPITGCRTTVEGEIVLKLGGPNITNRNPFCTTQVKGTYEGLGMVYQTLLVTDSKTGHIPVLAKSWEYDQATLTWTIHLNEKSKFSDNTKVTAEDVKYSWETAWAAAQHLSVRDVVDAITVADENTVKFKLKQPNNVFVQSLGFCFIVPKQLWSGKTIDQILKEINPMPVGSGPFLLPNDEDVNDNTTIFTKNPNYWDGEVNIDKVIFRQYGTNESQLLALLAGEIDSVFALGLISSIPKLLNTEGMHLYFTETGVIRTLLLNLRKEPFNLINFRKAIDMVIDRETIFKQILNGYGKVALKVSMSEMFDYVDTSLVKPDANLTHQQKVVKANQMLDSIPEMSKIGTDGLRTYKGKKLQFEMLASTIIETVQITDLIIGYLKEIGVVVTPKLNVWATVYQMITAHGGTAPLGWDLFNMYPNQGDWNDFSLNYAQPAPAPLAEGGFWRLRLYQSEAIGWTNAKIQSMMKAESTIMDPAEALSMRKEIQKLWAEELPIVTLYAPMTPGVYGSRFTGYEPGILMYGTVLCAKLLSPMNIIKLKPANPT